MISNISSVFSTKNNFFEMLRGYKVKIFAFRSWLSLKTLRLAMVFLPGIALILTGFLVLLAPAFLLIAAAVFW